MATEVNRYRVFCQTESNYTFVWDTSKPTTCPNNITHTIDSNSISIIDTIRKNDVIVDNLPISSFDEVRVVEKTPIYELKSIYGKSVLRDIYSSNGTAQINNAVGDGQYELCVFGANDNAKMQSAERGTYSAGKGAEVGIGVRIPQLLTSNQYIQFGLYDDSNGFYFKYNKDGLNVGRRRNGIDSNVIQSNLNIDKLDGTGPSELIYDAKKGYIYYIRFSWYGFGQIEYSLSTKTKYNTQRSVVLHRTFVEQETSIKTPNLPLTVEINNGGFASSNYVYVSGRQYSIVGRNIPTRRTNGTYVANVTINSLNTFVPVMSIRKKTGYYGNRVEITSADFVTSTPQLIQLRIGGTLTNANYRPLPNQINTETAVEYDTSASAISGGVVLWVGYMPSDRAALRTIDDINEAKLSEGTAITVCAQNVQQSGSINAVLRWSEEW